MPYMKQMRSSACTPEQLACWGLDYEFKFKLRGHVVICGRLCISLVVFLILCILKLFFNIRNIDFGLLKPNFGYQPEAFGW